MDQANRLALAGIEIVMLQLPEANLCKARNAGLEYALRLEAEWLMQWDDDDHYLPTWIATVSHWAAPDRIVGCLPYTLVDDRGLFGVRYTQQHQGGPVEWVGGATHSYPASIARRLRYPEVPAGEDVLFCKLAAQLGIASYDIGPGHFVYERRGARDSHAWKKDARSHIALFNDVFTMPGTLENYLDSVGQVPRSECA